MKFTFIGDPERGGDGPNTIICFGIEFPKGESVDVTDEKIIGKLTGNSHFDDGSDNGTGSAKTPDDATVKQTIQGAVKALDPENNGHWTKPGAVRMSAFEELVSDLMAEVGYADFNAKSITHADVMAIAPDFDREVARKVRDNGADEG